MRSPSSGEPDITAPGGGGAEWRCDVCDQVALHVVGVAAVVGGRLRFWLGGCCHEHEADVRDQRKAGARALGIPEITVTQVLVPGDVDGWVRRLERELAPRA